MVANSRVRGTVKEGRIRTDGRVMMLQNGIKNGLLKKFLTQSNQSQKSRSYGGGNYFTDHLPPTMRWLIWDKGQRGFSLADCEVAWTSQNNAMRIFDYARAKALQDGKKHPTQKPIALMEWCLGFVKDASTILDPFMGSGTTLVACQKMGRAGTGIELDPEYFEIACRRVDEATRQPDMFVQSAPQPKQESMF